MTLLRRILAWAFRHDDADYEADCRSRLAALAEANELPPIKPVTPRGAHGRFVSRKSA